MSRCAGYLSTFTAILMLAATIGCSPAIRRPNWSHPGTAQQQRAEAQIHDPFPLDDVAPEIVGGRPREYARPAPEVERARQFYSSLPGRGRAPAYVPAPVIEATPAPYVPPPTTQPVPYSYSPAPPQQVPYNPSPAPPSQPITYPPPFRY